LADGELRVNLERALDRPESPEPEQANEPEQEPFKDESMFAIETPPLRGKIVPFSGKGYRLG
jgi:hypothetical protein